MSFPTAVPGYPLAERSAAIADLADQIESGELLRIPDRHHKGRLLFSPRREPGTEGTCLVCGIALVHKQVDLCWGHWDYIIIDAPVDDHERGPHLDDVIDELRSLTGLEVRQFRGHYNGVMHGGYRCEVCPHIYGVNEIIVTSDARTVRKHCVCPDHVTFRTLEVDNTMAGGGS